MKITGITKEKMKGGIKRAAILAGVLMGTAPVPVSAAEGATGFDTAINMINVIKAGFIAIVGGVGVIIVVKSISEIGTALKENRGSEIKDSLMGLLGGGIMAGVSVLLAAFGFN